ncbi:alpha/beta fold hydrolase [Limosilactobacillus antri]|uniref:Halo peroxidase n=1 Tax=Limosilactobacillus antri DSM 16041 TaxID=525309 RepID=C8P612_9LACO|nr:alpha/beta hydrolase [Limosilactobacillus antri]EEW54098.1 hydrolase, alpha/beta domain protein [Limosilactobacillus antri DSM 16041]KRK60221.1 halo peroxidase [Limosilactobacillus antri DSM 16041]
MDFRTSDGVRINYQVRGSGQPVVLVHGFGGYQQVWCLQVPELLDRGYQVITYDQRNHGASGHTADLASVDRLIADLHELLVGLQVARPVLIGHSMGAAEIYGFLQRYPDFSVRGAIAIDQSPKMLNTAQWPYGYMDITRASYRLKLKEHGNVRETLNGVPKQVLNQLAPEKEMFPFVRAENLPLLYDHAKKDWRPAVEKATVPLLLVTANQSPYFDGRFADVLAAANPAYVTHAAVDQSGHVVMAEQAGAFNELMDEFLDQHRR